MRSFLTKPNLEKMTLFLSIALTITIMLLLVTVASYNAGRRNEAAQARTSPAAESEESYAAAVGNSINDTAAIEDVPAWFDANAEHAVQGIGYKKRALERRTRIIVNAGVREAGQQFLAAIVIQPGAVNEVGAPVYTLDRSKLINIDQEKLKRWAAIALVVLQFVEPFVPPPYNFAVHAAVMLLKLYLAEDEPILRTFFVAGGPPDGRIQPSYCVRVCDCPARWRLERCNGFGFATAA